MSSTGLNIEGESRMSREEYQQMRLGNYRAARDAVFEDITNGAEEKMQNASNGGQTRVCIYTYDVTARDDDTYVFGAGGEGASDTFKGLYVKTIFNARGVPRDESLMTRLYRHFNQDTSRRVRIYQRFNQATTPKTFEIYLDWTPRTEGDSQEVGHQSGWQRVGPRGSQNVERGQYRGRGRFQGQRGGQRGGQYRGTRQNTSN
jgi:hypothetical protein